MLAFHLAGIHKASKYSIEPIGSQMDSIPKVKEANNGNPCSNSISSNSKSTRLVKQREIDRLESTTQTEGDFRHPRALTIGEAGSRIGPVKSAINSKVRGCDLVKVRDATSCKAVTFLGHNPMRC